MPSPKSGQAGTAVSPTEPKAAEEADKVGLGDVLKAKAEQVKTKVGKLSVAKFKPHKAPQTEEEKVAKPSWIEIELRDDDGKPIPGEPYEVILPNGQVVAAGTLDEKGIARIEGIEPGQAEVHFPNQEDDQWRKG